MITPSDLGKFLNLGSLERAPTTGQTSWTKNPRILKRVGFGVVGFILSVTVIAMLVRLTPEPTQYVSKVATQYFHSQDPENTLTVLDAKYAHLRDDKFTYVIHCFACFEEEEEEEEKGWKRNEK